MRVRVLAAAAALAFIPAGLSAQACLGLPSSDGQIAIAGTGTSMDGELELGGEFHVDVTGPASFRVGYNNGHDDGIGRSFSALGSYEMFLLDPSICAVGGLVYTTDPTPDIDNRFGITLGFGLGKTLEADAFSATIYALPQYVRLQETTIRDETLHSNEFMAEAGVTFGFHPFFVGGAVMLSTFGDTDPGLKIRAGLLF